MASRSEIERALEELGVIEMTPVADLLAAYKAQVKENENCRGEAASLRKALKEADEVIARLRALGTREQGIREAAQALRECAQGATDECRGDP